MSLAHAVLGHARPAAEAGAAVPHVVAWNLTRRCNLSCAHCYIAAGPEVSADGELSTDEVRRIADEILALNPSPMFIFSGGEPLLREDLGAIARHASERGATVVVGTNATLLDDARIDELMDCGVTGVAVSVDSLRPAYHDRFRRGPGALEATLAAVERLSVHGLDFVVQATLTRGNRAMCGGCRARAYAASGDPLGADPACAYAPDGVEPTVTRTSTRVYGAAADYTLPWSADAQARMRAVPSFVRGVVVGRVEDYARREGHAEVTIHLLAEVRRAMPVDFSRRRPFFLGEKKR